MKRLFLLILHLLTVSCAVISGKDINVKIKNYNHTQRHKLSAGWRLYRYNSFPRTKREKKKKTFTKFESASSSGDGPNELRDSSAEGGVSV